jgi:energy-coupling factor transport system substrate-specific component
VALVSIAVAINIAINFVTRHAGQQIHLPLLLGRFGTVLAGALGGPWAGGVAGVLSNLIYGLAIHPPSIPYAVVNLAVGIFVGLVARWFDRQWAPLVIGVTITFIAAVLSAAIGNLVYGGVPGNGMHFLTTFFLVAGRSLRHYLVTTEFLVDIVDKIVTCYIIFFVIRSLPQGTRVRFGVA